jgi:hypothetical protein
VLKSPLGGARFSLLGTSGKQDLVIADELVGSQVVECRQYAVMRRHAVLVRGQDAA